jgi:hypothetical protein
MENHEQVEFSWFSSFNFEMRNEKVEKKRREQISSD